MEDSVTSAVWDLHEGVWETEPFPEKKGNYHFVNVILPDGHKLMAWVVVESNGEVWVDRAYGFGRNDDSNTKNNVREWLSEWELIVLRKVSHEDHEWFATQNLDAEYGLEE